MYCIPSLLRIALIRLLKYAEIMEENYNETISRIKYGYRASRPRVANLTKISERDFISQLIRNRLLLWQNREFERLKRVNLS